jgi:hypothetical protein
VNLRTQRLLAWLLISGGRRRLRTRVTGCNYCGESIMVAVVTEEGAG